jgi:hypothetical protein
MLGTCPVNSQDRLSAKNGQDLSLYATLYKSIYLLKFADTGISNLGQIVKKLFSSLSPGNVGNFFCEQPGPIICQKWSRIKPICYFIEIHIFAQICSNQQFTSNF